MIDTGLTDNIISQLIHVFESKKDIERVVLFGSRAKGCASPNSDIDISIVGIKSSLDLEAIALELEMLPFPYKFDVQSYEAIKNTKLREHIDRIGMIIYERH